MAHHCVLRITSPATKRRFRRRYFKLQSRTRTRTSVAVGEAVLEPLAALGARMSEEQRHPVGGVSGLLTNPLQLHPLAGLERGVEYMDLEEEQLSTMEGSQGLIPSRGWTDDLCYGTGAVYLTGLGLGGVSGVLQGLRAIPSADAPGKLKLNTVLNSVTKRGPFLGNTAGVLALSYNVVNSSLDAWRGKHDAAGSIASGALVGTLFRSSRGPKQMLISGSLMAGVCALWSGLKDKVLSP
ncbi:protein transporter TIM23 KNAG_0D00520 [Huiozyma naganishii CBS 8797]|uniref:Mitochondrial import inner membrane translocase subunit TIM23 n=1 Tax=Huiozyma naganishii (strain ATCC MYA-139 / BCRC 22969 / CBS 8797 / KCTC 17520 / NBRC 10181 / NCYC 3082 / Yp74L-3) TaxID=1071383 RepID=J7S5E3_HUIN7|nr:hypothetical protein KNAG_0D00520 [Kazachstania naganishii CBS 8797]CCK69804.1 hypothetical protein KNAG_0D00520 [Kazachstania naganishii CBS 8797]